MKRLLALLLVLVMLATMLVACKGDGNDDNNGDGDGTPCAKCVDADLNGKCDVCGADVPLADAGLAMMQAITAQLKAAKSMKLTVESDAMTNDCITDGNPNGYYYRFKTKTELLISIDENGFDLRADYMMDGLNKSGEITSSESGTLFYLIDDVFYAWDDDSNVYRSIDLSQGNPEYGMTTMLNIVVAIYKEVKTALLGISMTEEQQKTIGNALIELLSITGTKGGIKLDIKAYHDKFETYVDALDPETKTVGALLDDMLALVDKELTAEALLDKLAETADLTVWEAVQKIDAWLAEDFNTSLQAIYDKLAATDTFQALLAIYTNPESDTYQAILTFRIADIKDAPVGATTLYDLVMSLIMGIAGRPEAPDDLEATPYSGEGAIKPGYATLEEVIALIKTDVLPMTLAELAEMTEIAEDVLDYAKDWCDSLTVNECYLAADVTFKGAFLVDTLTVCGTFDAMWVDRGMIGNWEEGQEPEYSEWSQTAYYDVSATLTLSDISTEVVTITPPANVAPVN